LSYAYWINGVLLSIPFNIFDEFFWDPLFSQAWQRGYFLLELVVFPWMWWGIWRSAVRYTSNMVGGRGAWSPSLQLLSLVFCL
jgi:hypothetical protein